METAKERLAELEGSKILPVWPIPTRDEFVDVIKCGYGAIIREADDWRPLAKYIADICHAVVKGYEKQRGDAAAELRDALVQAKEYLRTANQIIAEDAGGDEEDFDDASDLIGRCERAIAAFDAVVRE